MKRFLAAFVLIAALAGPAYAESAIVRGLDKVTGHAADYRLPIGRAARIGSLEVIARSCRKSAPEDAPEVEIYVEVVDYPPALEGQEPEARPIFNGWLFASSPGLNAIEHPVYDLWAIDCRG